MNKLRIPLTDEELSNLRSDDFIRLRLTDDEKVRLKIINEERMRIRQVRLAELNEAAQPFVKAVEACGVEVIFWDLASNKKPYIAALPILIEHLQLDYPKEIRASIARALAIPEAKQYRPKLIELFTQQPLLDDHIRQQLAVAIGATTDKENVWETMTLLKDSSLGQARSLIIFVMYKVKEPELRQALLDLRDSDPQMVNAVSELAWVKKLDKERKQGTKAYD